MKQSLQLHMPKIANYHFHIMLRSVAREHSNIAGALDTKQQ